MRFTKMHGAGNDYIYVDCFSQPIPQDAPALAEKISDRHFGVGGDGLILICPSDHADAEMRMYNADGSPAEMCGNGIRCVAKYLFDRGIAPRNELVIESGGRSLKLDLETRGGVAERVRVDMGEPELTPASIPTTLGSDVEAINEKLDIDGEVCEVTCVSMGNPHCVLFVNQATDEWVHGMGPRIEVDPHFPNRTNVEFVEVRSRSEVRQRTWERGSGETMACGTGAAAVCVAGVLTGRTEREIAVHLLGGILELVWSEESNRIFMTGPAVEVFTGEWEM